MRPVEVTRGDGPVILGMPHTGTHVPELVWQSLNETGRALADTDWHIDRLYRDLLPGATIVRATFHRYVIDANRDPAGTSLYPGRNTTGLCPLTDFDGHPIYREGREPDGEEIEVRRRAFHAPYHAALAAELRRIHSRHGTAILYDCHSIRSQIPFLFEGVLPVLNIGTNDGSSCGTAIGEAAFSIAAQSGFETVLNGRFKGGWTTRHYGNPGAGIHAIQMETAQRAYLADEAPPWSHDDARAAGLRKWLGQILERLADIAAATVLEKRK